LALLFFLSGMFEFARAIISNANAAQSG